MTDIEINRSVKARPLQDVADQLGIQATELLPYGKLKAKVSLDVLERLHAGLGEHDVVRDDEVLDGGRLDERRADALVLVDRDLVGRRRPLVIHLPESSGHRVPRSVERVPRIGRRRHGDDGTGRVLAVSGKRRRELHFPVNRLDQRDRERRCLGVERGRNRQ